MQKIGLYFLIWAAILGGIMVGISQWGNLIFSTSPRAEVISHNGQTSVVLNQNWQGHYLAEGKINGERVTFLLDTGATMVAVPAALAQKVGLEKGYSHQVHTANGTTTAHNTSIDSVILGDIEITNVNGAIVDNMGGNEVLLGMSFLKHLNFSQQNGELMLSMQQ